MRYATLFATCALLATAFPLAAYHWDDKAPAYLGQAAPGDRAELFAPGIVSDGLPNRDLAITPDGAEIYYSVNLRNFDLSTIMLVRRTGKVWDKPEVAPFAKDPAYRYLEPAISPDGSRMFYVASRRDDARNNDIWVMEREGDGWGEARKLGERINTAASETFPSLTSDGTLYFSRAGETPDVEHIYRARLVDGVYGEPEKLPENVNSGKTQFNAFVAPDESYVIVSVWGRDDSLGSVDYYITYRNDGDEWSEPVNMGEKINSESGREYSAYVSRDGKYLFFMATRSPAGDAERPDYSMEMLRSALLEPENGQSDIYWIDASIIDELRPDGF